MAISKDEFVRFLTAFRRPEFCCNYCGFKNFLTNIASSADSSPAEIRLRVAPQDNLYHSTYTISCGNCGNTLFFHESRILQWLEQNKAADA